MTKNSPITERLRNTSFDGHRQLDELHRLLMLEAAREIERLQEALKELTREERLGPDMTDVVYGHKARNYAASVLSTD